jgi:hypothetical protein
MILLFGTLFTHLRYGFYLISETRWKISFEIYERNVLSLFYTFF